MFHERADWLNRDRDLPDRLERLMYPERFDDGPTFEWPGADLLECIGEMVTQEQREAPRA